MARQGNQGAVGSPNADNPNPKAPSDKRCPKKGNPIIVSTGNKIELEEDFAGAGEAALRLERTWNQHSGGVGIFGSKWVSSFDYRLSFGTNYALGPIGTCFARPSIPQCTNTSSYTEIWAHKPDGRLLLYMKAADGIFYEDKAGPISTITRQGDGSWILRSEENDVETYSVGGYPMSIKNSHGIGWTFTHGGLNGTQLQRVTHTSGRYVQFVWSGDELIEVQDPAQTSYRYTYSHQKEVDGLHLLATTTLPGPGATVIKYHYSGEAGEATYAASSLTGKSYNGVRYSTFTYNASMRATSTEHAGGVDKYAFSYVESPNGSLSATEVNPLGKRTVYTFNPAGNPIEIIGEASTYCLGAGKGSTYDANGYLDVAMDFKGNISNYDYDARGLLQRTIEGEGTPVARTTTYSWDVANNRVTGITIAALYSIGRTFAADNRLLTTTETNLSASGVPNQSRTVSYSYTKHQPSGMLATATIDGPLPGAGDAVVYTYDPYGNLTSVQNSLGHVTTYSNFNQLGQPGRVTSLNGAITEYLYDPRGRTTTEKRWVNGAWQTTTNIYDGVGRLVGVQRPDGQTRTLEYDAAWRVIREYEPEAGATYAQTRYSYNNASLVTRIDTERTTAVSPPPAPSGLVVMATAAAAAVGNYTVNWGAAGGADTYTLEESLNGGAWGTAFVGNTPSKVFASKPSGSYVYRAVACNAAGCSAASSTGAVHVATTGVPALTGPPTSNTTGFYTVKWSTVAATSFQLEESTNGGAWMQVYIGGGTGSPQNKPNGNYAYRVKACDSVGCGAYSAARTITVELDPCPTCFAPPPPPEELRDGPADPSGGAS